MDAPAHILVRHSRPAPRASAAIRLPSERLMYGVLGIVGLLVVWETVAAMGVFRKELLSSPSLIWAAALADFGSGTLWPAIGTSFKEWALGFAISLAIGIPLGLAIGWFRRVEYVGGVWLSAAYATPKVALFPLITLVAGIGLESKVIVVVLLAVFPVIMSTAAGVQSLDRRYLQIARSFRASQNRVFRAVVLPSAIPFILSGIRIGVGRALVGVVVAEFLSANEGLGYYILFSGSMLQTSRVMLGIILFGAFGIGTGELVRVIEHRFDVWRPEIR